MIYTAQTKKAMQLAYDVHSGQLDKAGVPYLFHIAHVAEQMPDECTAVAALLHDVMEDSSITEANLLSAGFLKEAIDAVCLLTHQSGVPYLDYIRTIRANRVARAVKLADLAHNSDLSRLEHIDDAARRRSLLYAQAIAILQDSPLTEVVAALFWNKDRFMICQRPAFKARGLLWEFVGGKVEMGETKEQALIRECREELGIAISVGNVFMDVTHSYPDLTVHLTLYHASIEHGDPQLLEHNDIRWITAEEIDQYSFCPADTVILEQIKHFCHTSRQKY